jgi:hypothetical protein
MTIIFDNRPNYLSNSRFKVAKRSGTGNSTCPVSEMERVRLQNHIIDDSVVSDFMQFLYDMGEDIISVELSHRQTTQRWGTAWTAKRRVVLYRHTAWTFLHEVAHVINDGDARAESERANAPYFQYKRKAHGRSFGKYQQMLYDLWMEHIEPRWDELKIAALNAPAPPKVDPVKAEFEKAFVAGQFGMMVSVCVEADGNSYIDGKGAITDYRKYLDMLVKARETDEKFKPLFTPPKRHVVTGGDVQVGDKVWFWSSKRKTTKITGIVKRVNLKTCRITNTPDGTDWRISPRLLNKEI